MADRIQIPIDLTIESVTTGSIDVGDIERHLSKSLSAIAKNASEALGQVDTSAFTGKLRKAASDVVSSFSRVTATQARYEAAQNRAGQSTDEFKQGLAERIAKLKEYEAELKHARDAVQMAREIYDYHLEREGAPRKGDASSLATSIQDLAEKEATYRAALEELTQYRAEGGINFAGLADPAHLQGVISAYNAIINAINKAEEAQRKYNEALANNEFTKEYTELQKQLNAIQAETDKLVKSTSGKRVLNPEELEEAKQKAEELSAALADVTARMQEMRETGTAYSAGTATPERFETDTAAVQEQAQQIDDRLNAVITGTDQANARTQLYTQQLLGLGATIKQAFNPRYIINFSKKLISLFALPFRPFINSIKDVRTALVGLWSRIRRIVFYRLIRSAIKAVTDGLKEGTQNLYQWSKAIGSAFAPALDNITASMQYFKNSIAAAAAPLLEMLAPAVNTVTNAIVNCINQLNQFLSILTGKSSWYRAIRTSAEYAESAASSASSAAKELQNTLFGFDELNVLNGPSGTGSGGGGGASDTDYAGMFEEVPIDTIFADAIASNNWYILGKAITDGLADAMESINWNNIQAKALLIAERFSSFLNGAFENKRFWIDLGHTLGAGINTATLFVVTFTEDTEWDELGDSLAESLREWATTLDWVNLGKTVTSGIRIGAEILHGFLSDWTLEDAKTLGRDIGDMIGAAFLNIPWETAIPDAVTFATQVLETINTALESIPWSEINEALLTGVSNSDWGALGNEITRLLKNLAPVITLAISLKLAVTVGDVITQGVERAIVQKIAAALAGTPTGGAGALSGAANFIKSNAASIFKVVGVTIGLALSISGAVQFNEALATNNATEAFNSFFQTIFGATLAGFSLGGPGGALLGLIIGVGITFVLGSIEGFKIWNDNLEEQQIAEYQEQGRLQTNELEVAVREADRILGGTSFDDDGHLRLSLDETIDRLTEAGNAAYSFRDEATAMVGALQESTDGYYELTGAEVDYTQHTRNVRTQTNSVVNKTLPALTKTIEATADSAHDAVKGAKEFTFDFATQFAHTVVGIGRDTSRTGTDIVNAAAYTSAEVNRYSRSARDAGVQSAQTMKAQVVSHMENMRTTLIKTADSTTTGVRNSLSGLSTAGTSAVSLLKSSLSTGMSQTNTEVTAKANSTVASVKNTLSKLSSASDAGMNTLNANATRRMTDTKTALVNTAGALYSGVVGKFSSMYSGAKGGMNSMIVGAEKMANGIIDANNSIIKSFDSIKIKGSKVAASSGYVNKISIPRLAQGAVLPPNKEFLAVLGDQTSGTNVEAPLTTIQEAVALVMDDFVTGMMIGFKSVVDAINSKDTVVQLDGNVITDKINSRNNRLARRYSPVN